MTSSITRCLAAVLLLAGAAAGAEPSSGSLSAPAQPEKTVQTAPNKGDELTQLIPAETMLCVRLNNFDAALGGLDQYITGVSPVPVATSMMARMQLGGLLGDPMLANINFAGSFAIFALALESTEQGNPLGNMFIAGMVPVTDYDRFVSDNVNCSVADANGISELKGGIMPMVPTKMLVGRAGSYAAVTSEGNYTNLVSLLSSSGGSKQTGLAPAIDDAEINRAQTEPMWIYGNVQLASKLFKPMLTGGIEKWKLQLEKLDADADSQSPVQMASIANMYSGMLNILLEEVKFFTITVNAGAQMLKMTYGVGAVPDTYLARAFVANAANETENKLLGYLPDGAMCNFGVKMNTPLWQEMSLSEFDFINFLSDEPVSDETSAKLEESMNEMVASFGGSGAVSMVVGGEGESMFRGQFVFEMKDYPRWQKTSEALTQIWNDDFANIYRKLGFETKYEYKRDADSYNGVSIDLAKYSMVSSDPNSDLGGMMDNMYGGGFEYRWAFVNGLCVGVMGSGGQGSAARLDASVRKLIDQVKTGGPAGPASEIKAVLATLDGADKAEFMGTYNYVRLLQMVGKMGPFGNCNGAEMTFPQIDIVSKSNIAFSGRVGNGRATVEIALPKEHLLEMKEAFTIMTQHTQQQQAAAQQPEGSTQQSTIQPEGQTQQQPTGIKQ